MFRSDKLLKETQLAFASPVRLSPRVGLKRKAHSEVRARTCSEKPGRRQRPNKKPQINVALFLAEFVERVLEIVCDEFGGTAFDVVAFEHVHQFTVFKQRDARR